jgi:hypothetical protein
MDQMLADLPETLRSRIQVVETGCWLWLGIINAEGYGRIYVGGTTPELQAHRVVYEQVRGLIPTGLTLDHLCRFPGCVNPAHMDPVTMRENILRGTGPTARNAVKTHCPKGHPLDGLSKEKRWANPRRYCKTCNNARDWKRRPRDRRKKA